MMDIGEIVMTLIEIVVDIGEVIVTSKKDKKNKKKRVR